MPPAREPRVGVRYVIVGMYVISTARMDAVQASSASARAGRSVRKGGISAWCTVQLVSTRENHSPKHTCVVVKQKRLSSGILAPMSADAAVVVLSQVRVCVLPGQRDRA